MTETITETTSQVLMGTVYTVAWADGTDAETIARFTPAAGRPMSDDAEYRTGWVMVGARLRRYLEHVGRRGCDVSKLWFAPWTDLADIASQFATTHGLPGRMGFEPPVDSRITTVSGSDFGGSVSVVEADLLGGARVRVVPLEFGDGWIALVADVSPVVRVLAVPSRAAAVAAAYMLSSDCRRTRTESLLSVAEHAHAAFGSFAALLSRRTSSRGLAEIEARAARLGQHLGLESAIPCPSLYAFADRSGKATISVRPDAVVH